MMEISTGRTLLRPITLLAVVTLLAAADTNLP